MALLNYLLSGTYSVVEEINYSKNKIDAKLVVYSDSTKSTILAIKKIWISRGEDVYRVKGMFVSEPPEVFVEGDSWVAREGYSDKNGTLTAPMVVTFVSGIEYRYDAISFYDVVFNIADSTYYHIVDGKLELAEPYSDFVLYDKYFNIKEEINIVRQVYLYLKDNINSFKNCEVG